MILGGHDGRLQVFVPDAGRPVADGKEVLRVEGVAYEAIYWSMVP